MDRIASIDIGTNSVLLLIAERQAGSTRALLERATITRLGEGVDRTRRLAPAACERTLACLREYASLCDEHGVEQVVAVGTSAMRDAANGHEFRGLATEILGAEPRVISGDEEASLTFAGALSGLAIEGPIVVFDVGGGSTEFIVGDASASSYAIASTRSLDIGSVRLFERFLASDPPSSQQCEALVSAVRRELARLGDPPREKTLVGVAGTVTTLCAIDQQLEPYDGSAVHGASLTRSKVSELTSMLSSLSTAERCQLPGLSPKRADVIVAGALLVREIMMWAQCETLVASDRGVRWGLVERAFASEG